MAKPKTGFQCQACGAIAPKWAGQCPDCGAWNSLMETQVAALPAGNPKFSGYAGEDATISLLNEVELLEQIRLPTGISEFDRVLGGGLVAGSVVLIGGDPGIGKSTLLLQMVGQLVASGGLKALYVTGEESRQQIAMRAQRLGVRQQPLRLLTETNVETILALASQDRPQVMIVDSIQTVYTELLGSAPGSVGQVRESAAHLVRHAKKSGTTIFLVGHVTKEGSLAGPRVLEHMVDTVLYFEGDTSSRFRIIRAIKNRYGAVNELGVFAMTDGGLREVANPSAIFLTRQEEAVPGSAVMVTREGTRPMLVEVQALVDESPLANPRRVTVGLDQNRLSMLLAVLHRHGGIATFGQDIFVNVVGGVRISETGADLAVAVAILSSLRNRPLPHDLVVFGEIGLAGELRPVQNGPERLREAAKHGFKQAIVPKANLPPKREKLEITVTAVTRLSEALESL